MPDGVVLDFLNDNHEVIARFVLADDPIQQYLTHKVQIPNDFLVSAGQPFEATVRLRHLKAKPPRVMLDARHVLDLGIRQTWDSSVIPSDRPLWAIVQDIAHHGTEFPRHGHDCACMDKYSWEIKAHVSKAIPPDRAPTVTEEVMAGIHSRLDAKARVSHVLGMVRRWL